MLTQFLLQARAQRLRREEEERRRNFAREQSEVAWEREQMRRSQSGGNQSRGYGVGSGGDYEPMKEISPNLYEMNQAKKAAKEQEHAVWQSNQRASQQSRRAADLAAAQQSVRDQRAQYWKKWKREIAAEKTARARKKKKKPPPMQRDLATAGKMGKNDYRFIP